MTIFKLTVAAVLLCIGQEVLAEEKIGPEVLFGRIFAGSEGAPLKDVTVTAILLKKKEKYTVSDGEGTYSFQDLKPGLYKFIFEKDGYRKVVKDKVLIRENSALELNVEMGLYTGFDLAPSPLHFIGEE